MFVRDCEIGPARPLNLAQVQGYVKPEHDIRWFFNDFYYCLSAYKSPEKDKAFLTDELSTDDSSARST